MKIVEDSEKISLIEKLNEKFKGDFSSLINYSFFKNSDNKYFIFSGDFIMNGDRIGLEAFKIEQGKIRLNIQFANLFKDEIKDYFIEIGKEEAKKFLAGADLILNQIFNEKELANLDDLEFYLLKLKDYDNFIGNVKILKKQNLMKNYLAKQYRFKNIII